MLAQIAHLNNEFPYKKVFVDTDNFGPTYLAILEEAYPKVKVDSLQYSMLNDLAYYWHTRNLVKAKEFAQIGLDLTRENKNTVWEGRFKMTQGAILLRMERLDDAQMVLEEAKNMVKVNDLPFLNTQLGYVYERRGQLDRAADYALEVLRLGNKYNDKKAMAVAYSDLSNLFWKQAKFDAGLEYGLKSLSFFDARGMNDLDYDFTLYVVGNNYLALKDFQKAQQYYEHALVIGERYGFYNNLSDIYISLTDLYAYLGEFEKAGKAGAKALEYAEMLQNEFMVMRSWLSIGKLQHLEGSYLSAIQSLENCIHVASDDFGDEYYLSQAYETLGKAYAGNHEYQKAYQAFSKYDILKNSIFTAEADQRTTRLRTEFDVADKEGKILLQENEIDRQKSIQTLLGIIAGLLLLLLALSYRSIRSKYKNNALLRTQNEEKEFLLKEIHHRVKNNLEVVSSLLSLQSAQTKDRGIFEAMEESRHRVHSMGMIHQKLYTGEHLAAIEMKDYFKHLSEYILDAFGAEDYVQVEVDMPPFELDVDMAIPIGLIVNELLTNAMKYAFPGRRNGKIFIGLKAIGNKLQLDVIDDGVGKTDQNGSQGTGFGSQLIALLTKQLDGKMVLVTNQGTAISIQFQYRKAA